ncbi:DUF805 domain-containing protein [Cryobacterium sp. TMT1-21]|uniref:DUF805 domain-containing protein n=1 Tax=Cryobacterium shii TaxID=1259235 RepID=A0AAQ2C4Z0_9MICO|nr:MULTISPECIES: DUF805 domain-containing protein [Cryobacterium]TFC44086.1 DUF805 domain-containing protein [Cryobacterium shii]TFC84175.1 DUF805 domain-containing protein [Cryobacterium sp. TmT2-59]TFD15466.1 DUF805 domain-containing protein [Cryobacterium sp. TMT4-10]TFD15762.1 DUF805 domain-containing protein [Cryobacterium sp. TMT2-23]TFD17805.1 DUF805 domain-containing protein [Cryobacterium sp. TMT1-21]
MTPVAALSSYFRKYADFTGRASRSEYWWVGLWMVVFYLPMLLVLAFNMPPTEYDAAGPLLVPVGFLIMIVYLATIVPNVSLLARRLHDANFAGWFAFLCLIPSLGGLAILVFSVLPSNPLGARFDKGAAPLMAEPTWSSAQRLG